MLKNGEANALDNLDNDSSQNAIETHLKNHRNHLTIITNMFVKGNQVPPVEVSWNYLKDCHGIEQPTQPGREHKIHGTFNMVKNKRVDHVAGICWDFTN